MTGWTKYSLGLLAAFLIGGVTSIIALKLQLPPYNTFASLYHQWVRPILANKEPGEPVVPYIRIATEDDVARTREQLIVFSGLTGILSQTSKSNPPHPRHTIPRSNASTGSQSEWTMG
jgi:hypothetical protein